MEETHIDSKAFTEVTETDARIIPQPIMSPAERWKTEGYNLTGCKHPGKFIIFNHDTYDKTLNLSERKGTSEDAKRVKATFEAMKFVEARKCQNNLTKAAIGQTINEVSLEPFEDYGCLIIVILTHGELGKLFANDKEYEVTILWDILTKEKNAKNLAGKPKLFLIQACQGNEADGGLDYTDAIGSDVQEEKKIVRIPLFADFLIAFSSSPGFASFRQQTGSWFIQGLCDAIDHFKGLMDFESILTLVKYDVARNKQSYSPKDEPVHNKKQIPAVSSTLTKKLYLIPAAATINRMPSIPIQHPDVSKHRSFPVSDSEESEADSRVPVKKDSSRKRSTTKSGMNSPPAHAKDAQTLDSFGTLRPLDPRNTETSCTKDKLLMQAGTVIATFLATFFIFWLLKSDYHIHCYAPQ